MGGARLDKWLWAARIFKTRTMATEACRGGRVMVNNLPAKASHIINTGDKVSVRKPPIWYTFQVLKTIDKRVGAIQLPEILKNVTSKAQLEILEMSRIGRTAVRDRGTGRPTKKDRREIDSFLFDAEEQSYHNNVMSGFGEDDETENNMPGSNFVDDMESDIVDAGLDDDL